MTKPSLPQYLRRRVSICVILLACVIILLYFNGCHRSKIQVSGPNINIVQSHTNNCYIMPAFVNPNSGPQNNYLRLVYSLSDAVDRNCQLAAYPIPVHKTQDAGKLFRTWNETFDIASLSNIITVITPEHFHHECNGNVAFRLCMHGYGLSYGQVVEQIKADTDLLFVKDTSSVEESFSCRDFRDRKCMIDLHPPGLTIGQTIIHNFRKATYIRNMAGEATKIICNGKPYMTLHWRNRTGERCTIWGKKTKECTYNFLNLERVGDKLVSAINEVMHRENIQCLYVAFPPFSWKIVDILAAGISELYTKENIIADVPSIAVYKEDNYVISLVEQEIAMRGELFLGCLGSAWSDMTSKSRIALGKLTTWLVVVPGIPEEVHLIN